MKTKSGIMKERKYFHNTTFYHNTTETALEVKLHRIKSIIKYLRRETIAEKAMGHRTSLRVPRQSDEPQYSDWQMFILSLFFFIFVCVLKERLGSLSKRRIVLCDIDFSDCKGKFYGINIYRYFFSSVVHIHKIHMGKIASFVQL